MLPLELELGMLTVSFCSSNDVDLIPLADVDVVTFGPSVDDLSSRCFGELLGELIK